jgi:hypothetical protein
MYGGLGERHSFGLSNASHYAGPVLTLNIPSGPTLALSPNFGLNRNSNGFLLRFMISYEIDQAFSKLGRGR